MEQLAKGLEHIKHGTNVGYHDTDYGEASLAGPTPGPPAQSISPLCECLEMEEAASLISLLLAVISLLEWIMSKERYLSIDILS